MNADLVFMNLIMKIVMEVFKLITNMSEIHTNSLDPMIHKQFKLVSIQDNNGLYGSNVKGINEAIKLESMSLDGLITFEEVKPPRNRDGLDGSHTHNVNADLDLHSHQNNKIWMKQKKQDFTRLSVRNINPELKKSFNKSLIDKYGTTKGKKCWSRIVSYHG